MSLRSITAMQMPDVSFNQPMEGRPEFIEVDPSILLVDEAYQRNLSDRSVSLVRRIAGNWDWRAFKPPVVVRVDGGLHVLDGQHTAIAATSHPEISSIPVMVVEASTQEERAGAFVKHNRDRITVTPLQLHYALVQAGDEDALTLQQACDRAGAKILKYPPSQGRFSPGDTMAVSSLRSLLSRRFATGTRRVLEICVAAKMAPISADALRAVETLLFQEEYAGEVSPEQLTDAIRRKGTTAEKEAAQFSAAHSVPRWRGLVVVWFKSSKRNRHGE